jgi:hypothetical protein
VAVVARILPRHWDGRRLLQFLTGLALIALSFAVRVDGPVATPVTVAAAPAAPTATVQVVGNDAVDVDSDRSAEPNAVPGAMAAAPAAPGVARVLTAPAGAVPPSYGSRAPPAT